MTKRKGIRTLAALALCFALCISFTVPAFAYADDTEQELPVTEATQPEATPETAAPEEPEPYEGEPIEGEGNAYTRDLLYDKDTHKQFITVEGRDGNTFYIVIDYDAPVNEDEEQYKTYFLNKVDEADLSALVEQGEPAACICTDKCHAGAVNTACPVCSVNMTECAGKEPEPEKKEDPAETDTEPDPEPEKKGGVNGMLAVVLAVALAGGGAVYILKFKKKKPDTKGSADLEDYDYGDEDEYEDEYEDGGAEDEGDE